MTPSERAVYLANVISVATADGEITGEEAAVLDAVARRIQAVESDVANARRLAAGAYTLRRLHAPEDLGANIEDMVLMALADGASSPAGAGPLEQLMEGLGYSQADMNMMVQRAGTRLRAILKTPHPPALPKRGAKPTVQPLRTRQAPSGRPPEAKPSPPPTGSPAAHPAPPTPPSPASVSKGTPGTPEAHTDSDPAAQVAACAQARASAAHPECYCFGAPAGPLNVWGCRLLGMDWSAEAGWLALGEFRDSDTFVFDTRAIGDAVADGLARIRTCPHARPDVAQAALAALPSRASVWGRWRRRPAQPSSARARPLVIREYRHGCETTSTSVCDGMAPTENGDAVRVILAATRRAGLHTVTRKTLDPN